MTFIYTLADPRTGLVRYLGKTCVKLNKRYSQHLYQWKRRHTKVNSWIKKLYKLNLKPVMEVVDCVENDSWEFWEKYYISLFKTWGFDLCNHTEGGNGVQGYKHSKQTIIKRTERLKSSDFWKERGEKHSITMKEIHKRGEVKFGVGHLSKERREELGKKHSKTMKERFKNNSDHLQKLIKSRSKKVTIVDEKGRPVRNYNSASEAATELGIENTHITRVCKGKSKSGMTFGCRFVYSEQV